jgi:hypothetical protein
MTGLSDQQRGVVESNFLSSMPTGGEQKMSDEEIVRAVARAVPPEKREKVLAMLKAVVGTDTTDTLRGSFNA